jgi:hypothetical protein
MRKREENVELWFLISKTFYFSKEKEKKETKEKKNLFTTKEKQRPESSISHTTRPTRSWTK